MHANTSEDENRVKEKLKNSQMSSHSNKKKKDFDKPEKTFLIDRKIKQNSSAAEQMSKSL